MKKVKFSSLSLSFTPEAPGEASRRRRCRRRPCPPPLLPLLPSGRSPLPARPLWRRPLVLPLPRPPPPPAPPSLLPLPAAGPPRRLGRQCHAPPGRGPDRQQHQPRRGVVGDARRLLNQVRDQHVEGRPAAQQRPRGRAEARVHRGPDTAAERGRREVDGEADRREAQRVVRRREGHDGREAERKDGGELLGRGPGLDGGGDGGEAGGEPAARRRRRGGPRALGRPSSPPAPSPAPPSAATIFLANRAPMPLLM